MIKYALVCKKGHNFEGWFSNSQGFEEEREQGRLACPHCGSKSIQKALMAPNVRSTKAKEPTESEPAQEVLDVAAPPMPEEAPEVIREAMQKVRDYVEKNADYVGDNFAEEARKIHYEEADPRGIYGEATIEEVQDLKEEGIDTLPLPPAPNKQN